MKVKFYSNMPRMLMAAHLVLPLACASSANLLSPTAQGVLRGGAAGESPPYTSQILHVDAPTVKGSESAGHAHEHGELAYVCPMHPEVQSDKPGKCPKCGMKLVPRKPQKQEELLHEGH